MACRFRQSFAVSKITLVRMSNIRSFYGYKYYEKTTKTDKHVLVFFNKALRFVIYFYEGFSQLRIYLPTSVCCFRQTSCRKIASFETWITVMMELHTRARA
jgi:hypothetical protein